jgi:hypothetical protein
MRLSVVMAVRNGEPYVREAIESVLAQSVTDFEFLIVDDASTDDTPRILSEYQRRDSRIRVLHNESHLGPYPSANRALVQARADHVARHDADDVSPPDRFAIQLQALDSGPDVVLVTGAVDFFGEEIRHLRKVSHPPSWQPRLEWELLFGNVVGAGAHVMFPRMFRGMPVLFAEEYFYAGDYRLWGRLSRMGRVVCPVKVVYHQRLHGSSISSLRRVEQEHYASMVRQELQSQYLRSAPPEAIVELSRFWIADGSRPLTASIRSIRSTLVELRANFLAYIEQRYGPTERARLEAEIDTTLSERLGYWLLRSIWFLDWRSCGDLLSKGGGQVAAASLGKLWRRRR